MSSTSRPGYLVQLSTQEQVESSSEDRYTAE